MRRILHPGNHEPWPEVRDQLNRTLRGWANYFRCGTLLMAYRAVDNHVLDRVRHFMRRRKKVRGPARTRFSDTVVFGELGVLRMRTLHLGPAPRAAT